MSYVSTGFALMLPGTNTAQIQAAADAKDKAAKAAAAAAAAKAAAAAAAAKPKEPSALDKFLTGVTGALTKPPAPGSGGGTVYVPYPQQAAAGPLGVPTWMWLAGGAAVMALVVLKKKRGSVVPSGITMPVGP